MSEAPAPSGQGAAALAAPSAAPAPVPHVPPAEGGTPPADWTSTFTDELDRGYVQNKGWKDQNALLKSYRDLEKLKGVPPDRLLKLPEKDDDPEWNGVWSRLGKPEKPEDYGIDVGDPEYGAHLAKVMHEQNMTKKQAAAFIKADNEFRAARADAEQKQFEVRDKAELDELKTEWGAGADGQIEIGRRFAKQMGLDADTLGKLNQALGTKGLLKFMAKAGAGLAEHEFAGGNASGKFGLTPEAAKARMEELKGDPEWTKRYLAGGSAERSEMERLIKFANGVAG